MPKLLQGKSLYISKHMHGQLLHSDKDDHADPRPISMLYPCISTIAYQGGLLDKPSLRLQRIGSTSPYVSGDKIGYGSFLIPLTKDTYRESKIIVPGIHAYLQKDHYFPTWRDIVYLHWVDFYPDMNATFSAYDPLRDLASVPTIPGKPNVKVTGNLYNTSITLETGDYSMSAWWYPDSMGDDRFDFYQYSCPLNTRMRWTHAHFYQGVTIGHNFQVMRDSYGVYHIDNPFPP